MSNGLTPMGKYLDRETSDKLKRWDDNTCKSAKLAKSALFCVLTVDSEWMFKGYIGSSGVTEFDNEHEAIEYIDNWHRSHKGYAKFVTPGN